MQVYMDGNQTVLYTDNVEYVAELVQREDADPYHTIFVQFVPKNGPGRGLSTKVPLAKVDSVVDSENEAGSRIFSDEEKVAIALSIRVNHLRAEIERGAMDEYLAVLDTSIRYRLGRVGQAGEARKSRA